MAAAVGIRPEDHLGLARLVVNRRLRLGSLPAWADYDELMGIASLALVEAVETWDARRARWSTWAARACRQAIWRAVEDTRRDDRAARLDEPAAGDGDGAPAAAVDALPDPGASVQEAVEEALDGEALRRRVRRAVGRLSARERRAVWLYFRDAEPMPRIAAALGVTTQAVSLTLRACVRKVAVAIGAPPPERLRLGRPRKPAPQAAYLRARWRPEPVPVYPVRVYWIAPRRDAG